MIICPHVHAHEADEMRRKFDLDGPGGRRLPFYLWHDSARLGPERAFEHCWNQHPDHDIVIVHSDMAPMPEDRANQWFDRLLAYRDELPQAGMIACNLFYPWSGERPLRVQCAGGSYRDGEISYLTGDIGDNGVPAAFLERVRQVDWVTFGGVLIRREAIRACGAFDRRYTWAYLMDADYCFEARLRGFLLYQVPVSLVHEESRTTRPMIESDAGLRRHIAANKRLLDEKWLPFRARLPSRAG
jgi:GT2 family glycosyltransferase